LEEEQLKRLEEETRRREEERKRLEEEARRREIERQRQIEEAERLQALQEELRRKDEELAKLRRALPNEAVTAPIAGQPDETVTELIVRQPDADKRQIEREEEHKRREEEAHQREEAERRQTLREEIDRKKEDLAELEQLLLHEVAMPQPEQPVAPAVRRKTRSDVLFKITIAVSILIIILTAIYLHLKSVRPEPDPTSTPRAGQQEGDGFTETARGLNLELVRIPAGSFTMGSPDSEGDRFAFEGPQHRVTLPSFYIGKYEVTQAQWRKVAGLPKVDADLVSDPANFKGDKLPVERVSYWEAREFCLRLSRETGRDYRLPSEAEWEYAARAGTTTPFAFGSSLSSEQANFDGNYPSGGASKGVNRENTTPVGSFAPNAIKLHDMHGNVWEWCEDFWHDDYDGAPIDGSAWLRGGDSNLRALRGGSWTNAGRHCRSAVRHRLPPGVHIINSGFRVAVSARK
jgi:formylglycine-generating enzyme required for sulfatase activity